MKRVTQIMMFLVAVFAAAPGVQAQAGKLVPYEEGLHYFLIEGAPVETKGPTEVVEAFSYMCSHCNTFDPYVASWKKRLPADVRFSRLPVVFGRGSWELYARAYVTADLLNVADKAHGPLMDRLWKEKQVMRSMDELATFYGQFGVDPEKFLTTSGSFAVDATLKKDQLRVQSYGVTGTPTMIVNGKYRVASSAAVPNFEVLLDVVDFLIAQEAAARQPSSAATD